MLYKRNKVFLTKQQNGDYFLLKIPGWQPAVDRNITKPVFTLHPVNLHTSRPALGLDRTLDCFVCFKSR